MFDHIKTLQFASIKSTRHAVQWVTEKLHGGYFANLINRAYRQLKGICLKGLLSCEMHKNLVPQHPIFVHLSDTVFGFALKAVLCNLLYRITQYWWEGQHKIHELIGKGANIINTYRRALAKSFCIFWVKTTSTRILILELIYQQQTKPWPVTKIVHLVVFDRISGWLECTNQ